MPQLFDPTVDREPFASLRAELQHRLNDRELRAGAASTLNAHYTAPAVIEAMWRLVTAAGFDGGRVLEPGCGSGLFIGFAPDPIRRACRFVGIELEPVTARVAEALYPEAEIRAVGFETVREPDGSFDLAVGNVPFGKYPLFDPIHNPDRLSIHNHFALKALHLVKPGGLVAIVTSRYTLDARNPAPRRALQAVADLHAALRLPNGTHAGVAGTEVVTDVLLFRRRQPHETPAGFTWETTTVVDVDGHDVRVNDWFTSRQRGRIVGTLTAGRGMYSDGEVMVDPPTEGIAVGLAATVERIAPTLTGIYDRAPATVAPPPAQRPSEVPAMVGELGATATGILVEHTPTGPVTVKGLRTDRAHIVDLVRLRDAARTVMEAQTGSPTPERVRQWELARDVLNRRYDAYRARWKPINSFRQTADGRRQPITPKRFRDDPGWGLTSALEVYDPATGKATKAAIFEHWLATPPRRFQGADTPVEALATSLAAHGRVDAYLIGDLLACDPAPAIGELAAAGLIWRAHDDPERWEPAIHYLAGNVRQRLRDARRCADTDARYRPNVAALEQVLPEWLPAEAITARLGAVWIPPDDVKTFLVETLGADDRYTDVEHAAIIGAWSVTTSLRAQTSVAATVEWGTAAADAYTLVQDALNLTPTVVYRTLPDGRRERLEAETLAANDKRQTIETAFADWVWADPERAARLEHAYNDRFNSTVLARWDGAHLTQLPGLSAAFEPHRHQLNAVWRTLADNGNVLLGHRVGAGKTATMVIAGQQLRRTGQITKPLYVVPNHMLEQFAAELRQLYPMANVLVASKDDLTAGARRSFVARCATGDWDAVVMTHSTFGRVPVSADTEIGFIEDQTARFLEAADAARQAGNHRTVKAIERAAARWNSRLAELRNTPVDAANVTFEQLGVDYLFVDEAHAFKGLPFVTSLPIGTAHSKRATDMVLKIDWLHATYGPKVVTFATGTPVANSLAEMWVLQRFLRHDGLVADELQAFDSWAGTFARPVSRLELAPEGGRFRSHTRIAAFDNVPELLTTFRSFCDLLDAADLPSLRIPDLAGGRAETVIVTPTTELVELIAQLGERADDVRARLVAPEDDNMLKVCNDGRLGSLDLRLVGRHQQPGTGKVAAATHRIVELWQRHRDTTYLDPTGEPSTVPGALQLVFCDKGTPTGTRFDVYDELRGQLAHAGMDPTRIRFVHDATTDTAKQRLFNACRSGQVDVLVGSTEKMGVGTNIQSRLVALHHLDAPWRPADIEQREGRILRHGNQNGAVHVIRYVTEASFDPYMWQTLERKARFIAQVMTPTSPAAAARSIEDLDSDVVLSYAEIKAVATGNPLIREQAEVAAELTRLARLADTHTKTQRALPGRLRSMREHLHHLHEAIASLQQLVDGLVDTRDDQFTFDMADGRSWTERDDAGAALRDLILRGPVDGQWQPLGQLAGISWQYQRRHSLGETVTALRVVGDPTESLTMTATDLHHGRTHVVMTRLERHAEKLPVRLERAQHDLQLTGEQIERAERNLGQPFSHQNDLDALSSRLQTIEAELVTTTGPRPPAHAVLTSIPAPIRPPSHPAHSLGHRR